MLPPADDDQSYAMSFKSLFPLQGWKENVQKVIDAPQDFDSGSLEFSKVRALYESYSYSTVLSSANKISHCCLLFCCAQGILPEGNVYLWLKEEAMIIICNNCYDDAYTEAAGGGRRIKDKDHVITNFQQVADPWWYNGQHEKRRVASGYYLGCLCCLKMITPCKK